MVSLQRGHRRLVSDIKSLEITHTALPGDEIPLGQNTADEDLSNDRYCIFAGLLIPGRGNPMRDTAVAIEDGVIVFVGPASKIPEEYNDCEITHVPVLMPGFWDCHMHFTGVRKVTFANLVLAHPAVCAARMVRSFHDTLMSGCTSVRDVGSFALEGAKAIEEGSVLGPNIFGAGAAIGQTGGSCDAYELPIGCVMSRQGVIGGAPDYGVSQLAICDGVEECRRMVRLQLRRGASIIKVVLTGGVMSQADDPRLRQFSDEELDAIFDEARRSGRGVAAHAHGKAGIMKAVEMGATTIEHGTYIDEETADLMKEKGTILVATRLIYEVGMRDLSRLTPEQRTKLRKMDDIHKNAYSTCIKKGVKIALGTDICSCDPSDAAGAGRSCNEIVYAVEAGMTPLQALEAATATSAESLGPRTPKKGQILVGYDADVIGLYENPLHNIYLFKNSQNVSHVWKGGRLYKAPGLRPDFHCQRIGTDIL